MTANSMVAPSSDARRSATPLQAGMLFNALANPKSGVDIQQVAITLEESLDVTRFTKAWHDLILNHDILRTSFAWEGLSTPEQVVHGHAAMPVEQLDWSDLDQAARRNAKADLMRAERVKGFAMDAPSLMRLTIVRDADDRWWVLWTFHHAILDGRSFPLVLERLLALYDGVVSSLTPRGATFDDVARALTAIDHAPAKEAWRQRLAQLESPTSIDIPYQTTETAADAPGVSAIETRLDEATTTALLTLAVENEVSLNNVIQAAWTLLLHHYSQQLKVAFGTTRAGRHFIEGARDVIGLLINTVPFLVSVEAEDTLSSLLAKMHQEQRALRPLETTPLADIQAASSLGKTPVFDTIVMYDEATLNTRMAERLGARAAGRRFDYVGQTNFDLTLLAYAEPELLLRLEYSTARYNEAAARRILGQLEKLLKGFPDAGSTTQAVAIDYLLDEEKRDLEAWNATDVDWDLDTTLMALFERQVERTPDTPAITYKDTTLTYRAFNARANQLAHYLRKEGVAPDQLVGLAVERSIEMELGIYGVVKAGGAFVPLDPELPVDRLAFMAEDAGVRLILTQRHLADRLPADGPKIVALDGDDRPWADQPEANPTLVTRPDQLAYALFTSGSTGTPKCAMNEHRGIVNRILWMQDAFKLDASDTVLQKTPYSFDVSVWEHFWPLQVGARLVMAELGGHRDPAYLADIINAEQVTTIHFVPSMLQLFVEEPKVATCKSIRRFIASGEALPRELQDRLFALLDTKLHNLYGPTEAAIDVTWWACDAESPLKSVPIGRAIANTQIHLLDKQCRPVPPGVAGELFIGGVQVGRGYLNRDELTADRFIDDPFRPGGRLYKTGDLARFMPDGNVEYLGRLDHQVKVRGLRIELGEIEAVVGQHDAVREVVVIARENRPGQQMLVGYVVGDGIDIEALRRHALKVLADYMVPSEWVVLDAFPLNASGKVDRKRLPAPALAPKRDRLEPSSNVEMRIVAAWKQVLDHNEIGAGDTFFDVGGTSLSVIRLAHRLSETFEREVRVADLLRFTTVGQQAQFLDVSADQPDTQVQAGVAIARQQRDARAKRRRVLR